MSKITRQIAENISAELTKKKALEITQLKQNLIDKFTDIYIKSLPKEVIDLHKKYPEYVNARFRLQLSGNGFQYQYIDLLESLPSKNSIFLPSEKDAKTLHFLINEVDEKEAEYKNLQIEISSLLLGLKTYNRVNSEFPEATPFLPKSMSTALMVNISDLREKLK